MRSEFKQGDEDSITRQYVISLTISRHGLLPSAQGLYVEYDSLGEGFRSCAVTLSLFSILKKILLYLLLVNFFVQKFDILYGEGQGNL